MENERMITLHKLCACYNIETTFVHALNEYGFIEIVKAEDEECVEEDALSEIERIMHLHYDLDINLEGIDVINNLLKRVNTMQKQLDELRNKLG